MTDERIRVVYLAHAFMVGGAEEMVLNLVRHLPPRFEPHVCCINQSGPIGEEIRRTGVPFTVLGLTPGLRHPLELRAYRADGLVQLDWWYDTRSFDSYTVEELTEQLPLALIELTSEAMPQPHTPMAVGH